MDDLLLFTLNQEITYSKIRTFIKGITKNWIEDITQ